MSQLSTHDDILQETDGAYSSFSHHLVDIAIAEGREAYFHVFTYHQAMLINAADIANIDSLKDAIDYIRSFNIVRRDPADKHLDTFFAGLRPANLPALAMLSYERELA